MSVADGLGVSAPMEAIMGRVTVMDLMGAYTATGAVTLTNGHRLIQRIDPGGSARDVTLPAEEHGLCFLIANAADSAEALSVKDDAAGAVVTVSQNEAALVWCDGTSWYYVLFSAPAS